MSLRTNIKKSSAFKKGRVSVLILRIHTPILASGIGVYLCQYCSNARLGTTGSRSSMLPESDLGTGMSWGIYSRCSTGPVTNYRQGGHTNNGKIKDSQP